MITGGSGRSGPATSHLEIARATHSDRKRANRRSGSCTPYDCGRENGFLFHWAGADGAAPLGPPRTRAGVWPGQIFKALYGDEEPDDEGE